MKILSNDDISLHASIHKIILTLIRGKFKTLISKSISITMCFYWPTLGQYIHKNKGCNDDNPLNKLFLKSWDHYDINWEGKAIPYHRMPINKEMTELKNHLATLTVWTNQTRVNNATTLALVCGESLMFQLPKSTY